MVIGTCTIELHIPGNGLLKGKRWVIKSIIARVHNEFNVSIAEVGNQDLWQSATLGVACVSARRGQPVPGPTTGARLAAVGVSGSKMEVRNDEYSRNFGIAR
jgi:uncharacterized protein YlxP (DUF503 family)